MTGVGFSSWVIGPLSSADVNIDVSVDDFINLGEYISTPVIDSFKICPSGLVIDETICYTGEILVNTNLLLKNGLLIKRKDLTETLNLKIGIKNKGGFNFFSELYMGSLNPPVKYSFFENGITPNYLNTSATIENDLITTEVTYSNNLLQTIESISLNLIYYFDFSNFKKDFQSQIYDKLGSAPLSFDLNIEVM